MASLACLVMLYHLLVTDGYAYDHPPSSKDPLSCCDAVNVCHYRNDSGTRTNPSIWLCSSGTKDKLDRLARLLYAWRGSYVVRIAPHVDQLVVPRPWVEHYGALDPLASSAIERPCRGLSSARHGWMPPPHPSCARVGSLRSPLRCPGTSRRLSWER